MSKFSILYTVNPKKGMVFKMAKSTFKGGVHPYEGKELSKDKPIKDVLPKGDLVYPLSQHIGAPAVAIVAKGDRVLRGQKIAEAGGFVSAPIYASVSGTVKAIEPLMNPTGATVNCIVVENDGEYNEVEYPEVKPLEEISVDDIESLTKSVDEVVKKAEDASSSGSNDERQKTGNYRHLQNSPN